MVSLKFQWFLVPKKNSHGFWFQWFASGRKNSSGFLAGRRPAKKNLVVFQPAGGRRKKIWWFSRRPQNGQKKSMDLAVTEELKMNGKCVFEVRNPIFFRLRRAKKNTRIISNHLFFSKPQILFQTPGFFSNHQNYFTTTRLFLQTPRIIF